MRTFRFGWRIFGFGRSGMCTNILRYSFFNVMFIIFNTRYESMYMGFMNGLNRFDGILWRIGIMRGIMRDNRTVRWIGIIICK
jgi:hypothetical protein